MQKKIASVSILSVFCVAHLFASSVNIYTGSRYRYIKSDGLPNHSYGQFPNRSNPHSISSQNFDFKVPVKPTQSNYITELRNSQYFGVALNGVPFDPGTAELWQGDRNWRYEALSGSIDLGLDQNNAHVQPNGSYHYHGIPTLLISHLKNSKRLTLVGWAADGFPIYYDNKGLLTASYQLKRGQRTGGPGGRYDGKFVQDYQYNSNYGKLDECNGIKGRTNEFPDGTYFYVLTKSYPFIPRCFKGNPDNSFAKHQGGERHHPPHHRHRRHGQSHQFFGYTKVI